MKRKKLLIIFLILIVSVFFFLLKNGKNKESKTISYYLEGRKYKLLVADEPKEWERGLMFVTKPVNYDGMIFVFPDKKIRSFWNKNTYLDLNIYWINGKKVVGRSFLPSVKKSKKIVIVDSNLSVNKVIELIK